MKNKYIAWLEKYDTTCVQRQKAIEIELAFVEQAEQLANSKVLIDRIVEALEGHLSIGKIYKLNDVPKSLYDLIQSYPQEFKDALLFTLGCAERSNVSAASQNVAWIITAQAFGKFVARQTPSGQYRRLYHPRDRHPPFSYYREFSVAFHRELADNPTQNQRWRAFFQIYASNLMPDFEEEMFGPREHEIAAARAIHAAWVQNTNPYALVEERAKYRHHIAYQGTIVSFLELLQPVDRKSWLLAVEALPLPQLIEESVYFVMKEYDDDTFQSLLESAPVMFSSQNGWERKSCILLLVRNIVMQIDHIYRGLQQRAQGGWPTDRAIALEAEAHIETFVKSEARLWAVQMYTTVLERADGIEILLFFIKFYINQCTTGANNKQNTAWKAEALAVDVLAELLASRGITTSQLHQRWKDAEDHARKQNKPIPSVGYADESAKDDGVGEGARTLRTEGLPLLLTAIKLWQTARSAHSADASSAASLWAWFNQLLIGYDPGLSLLAADEKIFCHCLLGDVLAHCSDPPESWRDSFQALEPQRNRIRFRQSASFWRHGSTDLLNGVALVAWEFLMQKHGSKCSDTILQRLICDIFDTNWMLYLTSWQTISSGRDYIRTLVENTILAPLLRLPDDSLTAVKSMVAVVQNETELMQNIGKAIENLVRAGHYNIESLARRLEDIGMLQWLPKPDADETESHQNSN